MDSHEEVGGLVAPDVGVELTLSAVGNPRKLLDLTTLVEAFARRTAAELAPALVLVAEVRVTPATRVAA